MEGSSSSSSFPHTTPSSSSFASELFGPTETSSSSTGLFGSIFSRPSNQVLGRESVRSEVMDKKPDSSDEAWNNRSGGPSDTIRSAEGESQIVQNKDMSLIYQEQRVHPCHLCSSIYYGGQDIYSYPQSTQGSGFNPQAKTDWVEDDSGSASRGNWWQGSLYY